MFRDQTVAVMPPPAPRPVRRQFVDHYHSLRALCERRTAPGVAILAVNGDQVVGTLWLPASPSSPAVAIAGRHPCADLPLHDPALSLRHLALLAWRAPGSDPCLKVLDLQSFAGFKDEWGHRFRGLTADGPAFLVCGPVTLLCVPTGDGLPWPDDPWDGWSCFPDRIYRAEEDAVTSLDEGLLQEGEPPLGDLCMRMVRTPIGARALERGILLGRSERCQIGPLDNSGISRVHALLLKQGDRVYAVDTLSRNGTRESGRHGRLFDITGGGSLLLGERARLQWRPR